MNRKNTVLNAESEVLESGEYAVKRNRRSGVIAAILCLILSLFVWVLVMNAEETKRLELVTPAADAAYSYELSASELEVHGKLIHLRDLEEIKISLPEDLTAGESYTLTEANLVLPAGVKPAGAVEIQLTVTAK